MVYDIVLLAIGLAMIAKGGDLFVDSSINLAKAFQLPRIVIGATLVSLATTVPEMVVSSTASFMENSGIALGNAVGSAIANVGLIVGSVALLEQVVINRNDFIKRATWMAAAATLVILFSWNRELGHLPAGFLLCFCAAYLYWDYRSIRKQFIQAKHENADLQPESSLTKKTIGTFMIGATLIIIGSRILVLSGISLAEALGIPSAIIGVSIIAIGTSFPELVTGISSALKGVPDLSIGNILGANILNLTLIVGISGTINPLSISSFTQMYSYPSLVILFLVFIGMLSWRGTISKIGGLSLLALYAFYISGLVIYSLS